MTRDELTGTLRKEFREGADCGVEKVDTPGFENIWFVVPPAPPLEIPPGLPYEAIARANAVLTRLPSLDEMDATDRLVSYLFTRREAVQSSRLEGTWSTVDNVLTPARGHAAGEGKSANLSVRGYAAALERRFQSAADFKERIFTLKLVCGLHRDIVSMDPNFMGEPGALRTLERLEDVVQIGGGYRKEESVYNPAPPRRVRRCLDETLAWLSDEDLAQRGDAGISGFTLAVRLAIGHAHFEAVHPFSDGNGRVGRALWPLQMIAAGRAPLYLSGYVEAEKARYGHALQRAQKRLDYAPLVGFVCEAVYRSDIEARITKDTLADLPRRWRERAKFRAGSAASRALEALVEHPIITAPILVKKLGVSKQAINIALGKLVKRGVLRRRGRSGREVIYAAEELISLLSRNFGDDAELALEAGRRALSA